MAKGALARQGQYIAEEDQRVSTLELFFDLVFVFTITQLTAFLAESLSWESLFQSFLIFIVLYWMYGGYVWLTNSVPPVTSSRQFLLIAGMAAFLICALAIPSAFEDGGVIFGVGYLVVIVVHGFMYLSTVGWKISRIVPMNLLAAVAVIAAGFVDGTGRYALWLLAIVLHVLTSFLGTRLQFQLKVGHFVERHGLLLLVALGESIIAIGVGHAELNLPFIGAAVLGLILTAALWWIYFARDDEVAREKMFARSNSEQLRQALGGYFYAFVPMLFGIILLATGIHSSIEHLTDKLDPAHAFVFGGGVGLYLLGTIVFRRASGMPQVTYRLVATLLALLTGLIGSSFSAAFQFASLILIAIVLVLVESHGSLVPAHK